MYIKGYMLIFNGFECEIRKGGCGILVAKGIRANENVYYVKENKRSTCLLVQSKECWL